MSKMTVAVDAHGKIIGATMSHSLSSKHGDVEASVSFPGSHKLHKIEVDDAILQPTDAHAFLERLAQYLPKN